MCVSFFLRDWKIAQASFPSSSFMYLLYFFSLFLKLTRAMKFLIICWQCNNFSISLSHTKIHFSLQKIEIEEKEMKNYVMPEMKMKRFLLKWMAIADRQIIYKTSQTEALERFFFPVLWISAIIICASQSSTRDTHIFFRLMMMIDLHVVSAFSISKLSLKCSALNA